MSEPLETVTPRPAPVPAAGEPAPAAGLPMIKLFAWTRWLIVAAVLASLLLATVLLAYAAVAAVGITWDVAMDLSFTSKGTKELSIQVIEMVDAILLGTVVYIVALGLYELFIDSETPVPDWLDIDTLDDLKSKLVGVVVVLLAVSFLRFATAWDGGRSILYLGAGIALVIAALALTGGSVLRKK